MNSTDGNFSCFSGGTWYVCSQPELPRFVGCCVSDPCRNLSGQGCPIEDLRSASFNPNYYSSIRVNDCTDFAGSKWYTCAAITPPFLGCCKVDPCIQYQCPTGSLTGALWSDQQQEQVFLDGAAADPSAEVSSLIPTSSATSPVQATASASVTTSAGDIISSASSSAARNPVQATTPASVTTSTGDSSSTTIQSSNNGSGISTSAIVGIGIGAFAVIVILIAVLMFKCGWDARKKRGGRGTMATDYTKSSLSPDRDPHASSIISRSPQNWNAFDSPDMNSYHFPSRPYQSPGETQPQVDRYRDSVPAHGLYTGGLPPHLQELDAIEQQRPAELSEPYMGTHKY